MTLLMDVLGERAAGRIDDDGLARVAQLHNLLHHDKEASAPSPSAASTIGNRVLEALGRGIEHSVPMLVAGLGISGAAAGGRALMDRATKNRDLERILEVYPHLREWDRKDIELAYSSMRHMNPHIAKDPLAGGTLLGQMLRSRDPLNPKVLRFEPQLAGDLLRLNPKEEHTFEEVARDAVMKGMGLGADEAARTRQMHGQQAFQREMEEGKRMFDRERDTMRNAREDQARQSDVAERRRASALEQKRRAELERAKHEWGRGGKWEEQQWKREDEADRRQWQTGQDASNQAAQDRRAVMQAMLSKGHEDIEPLKEPGTNRPWIDPQTGAPYFTAPPTISDVLRKHYPGLRP